MCIWSAKYLEKVNFFIVSFMFISYYLCYLHNKVIINVVSGKLVADSKKTANAEYRRPYGAGGR